MLERDNTMEKLMELSVVESTSPYYNKHIVIYGTVKILNATGILIPTYIYPEISDISIYERINDKETELILTGETWAGRKYDAYDVISSSLSDLIRYDSSSVNVTFVCPALEKIVKHYHNNILQHKNSNIPQTILHGYSYDCFQLGVATNKFIYYFSDSAILMISTEDHSVISDNYFAEVGYYDSQEAVKNGKETLLFGAFEIE